MQDGLLISGEQVGGRTGELAKGRADERAYGRTGERGRTNKPTDRHTGQKPIFSNQKDVASILSELIFKKNT